MKAESSESSDDSSDEDEEEATPVVQKVRASGPWCTDRAARSPFRTAEADMNMHGT